jgi:hypothetical protein
MDVNLTLLVEKLMAIAEQIYALIKTLPQERAREVLAFAEFICFKYPIKNPLK